MCCQVFFQPSAPRPLIADTYTATRAEMPDEPASRSLARPSSHTGPGRSHCTTVMHQQGPCRRPLPRLGALRVRFRRVRLSCGRFAVFVGNLLTSIITIWRSLLRRSCSRSGCSCLYGCLVGAMPRVSNIPFATHLRHGGHASHLLSSPVLAAR